MDTKEPVDKARIGATVTSPGKAEGEKPKVDAREGAMGESPVLPPGAVKPEGYDDLLPSTQWELARGAETLKANAPPVEPPPEPATSTDITDISIANPAVVTVVDGSVLTAAVGIVISGTGNASFDKSFAVGEYTLAGNTITLTAVDNSLGTTHTGVVTCA